MNLKELAAHVAAEFQTRYGRPPRWIVAAPGRVNVIGEHTDYNDGFVLPMAIERYAIMAADAASSPGRISIYDTHFKERATIDIKGSVVKGSPKWSNYIRGVLAGFQQCGVTIPALDVAFLSTVPLGGGLSSSAALEVCTATLMEAATGQTMDPSVALLVINTNVKHELSGGEYAERRAQCEEAARKLGVKSLRDITADQLEQGKGKLSEVVFRRARHVIGEIERTLRAAAGIRQSKWPTVGRFMYNSPVALRDDYEVSCKELDDVVEIADGIGLKGGVYGCRMTGGGFGGCCVALMKADAVESITKKISTDYKAKTGIGATIFASRPAAGAMIIKG